MAALKKKQKTNTTIARGLRIGCTVSLFLLVVAAALSVPFVYESQTLWYKIGFDKTMLRAGKIAGLLTFVLLLVQILLGLRGKFLQGLFGVAALMSWHRVNGVCILFLALCHVTLVLAPEGMTNLPVGVKFWPEMVGALLLLVIISMVLSSQFRQQLGFVYNRWRGVHKLLGYASLALVSGHVLFVSESFQHAVPRIVFIIFVIALVVAVFWVKNAAFWKKWKS